MHTMKPTKQGENMFVVQQENPQRDGSSCNSLPHPPDTVALEFVDFQGG
jgi:hypothetical protein